MERHWVEGVISGLPTYNMNPFLTLPPHTHQHTHTLTHIHTHTQIHIHTHIYAYTHTPTHTHLYKHTIVSVSPAVLQTLSCSSSMHEPKGPPLELVHDILMRHKLDARLHRKRKKKTGVGRGGAAAAARFLRLGPTHRQPTPSCV